MNNLADCYPNPSSDGKWKLSFDSELENTNHLEVYNILGETVYKTTINEGSSYYNLKIPTIQSGMYMLHIYDDTHLDYIHKLIIE